jgi:quercetin dioxygenase-like cupin family protein
MGRCSKKKCGPDSKIMGCANRIDGMLDYQKHSVVSRTLLNKKTGTVTLFAFDKGQGLSEHTAPFDAMVVVVEGSAEISIAGKRQGVETGEMIMMPAGIPHAVRAVKKFKMMLVMIRS